MSDIKIKWKCDPRFGGIPEPVEVVSETECFVTIKAKKFFISGPDEFFTCRIRKDGTIYDSFEDAKAALIEIEKRRVINAEAEWQQAKDRLKKVNDLKKPVDTL